MTEEKNRLARWGKPAAFAVAALLGLAAGSGGGARAEQAGPGAVTAAIGTAAPLTALSVTGRSVQCATGRIAVDADGEVGFLAPVIGPNVLRGSAEGERTVSWAVVPRKRLGAALANTITVCTKAR